MKIRILGMQIYFVTSSLYIFSDNMSQFLSISSFDTQMPQLDNFARMKLEQSLKSLRIEADIIEVIRCSKQNHMSLDN